MSLGPLTLRANKIRRTASTLNTGFLDAITVDNAQGTSPSWKGLYMNVTIPATAVLATNTYKGLQSFLTQAASSVASELFGVYGNIQQSGTVDAGYGVVGEYANVTGAGATTLSTGVLGTLDNQNNTTSTWSAAVTAQVWDRATTGTTANFLALCNGDTRRNSITFNVGAAFKAVNRITSFTAGWNYGVDLAQSSGAGAESKYFTLGDIRLAASMVIKSVTTAVSDNDATTLPASSIVLTSNATGKGKIFVSDGTNLQVVTTT